MDRNKCTIYVTGFSSHIKARELAYEFERYGRLVRCDIPAPRSYHAKPYAFVEFEDPRDASDAYYELHQRPINGLRLSLQWARTTLNPRGERRPQHSPRGRSPKYRRSVSPRRRSPSPHNYRSSPSKREPEDRYNRSVSPNRQRSLSPKSRTELNGEPEEVSYRKDDLTEKEYYNDKNGKPGSKGETNSEQEDQTEDRDEFNKGGDQTKIPEAHSPSYE